MIRKFRLANTAYIRERRMPRLASGAILAHSRHEAQRRLTRKLCSTLNITDLEQWAWQRERVRKSGRRGVGWLR